MVHGMRPTPSIVLRSRVWAFAVTALCVLGIASWAEGARASETDVAVAANFAAPMQRIAGEFEHDTGHRVKTVVGATGNLYAQIANGAPFDVLLAADEKTPSRLEAEKLALAGSRFTYAIGRLVLWSATPGFVDERGDVLRRGAFQRLAVANAKLAPYGAAAMEVIDALGLTDALRPKLVEGENIAQTAQFVGLGSVELGFVALSQVIAPGSPTVGSYWVVPERLHAPIRQQAVLLARGIANPAARAFVEYLKGAKARSVIRAYGYTFDPDGPNIGPPAPPIVPPAPPR